MNLYIRLTQRCNSRNCNRPRKFKHADLHSVPPTGSALTGQGCGLLANPQVSRCASCRMPCAASIHMPRQSTIMRRVAAAEKLPQHCLLCLFSVERKHTPKPRTPSPGQSLHHTPRCTSPGCQHPNSQRQGVSRYAAGKNAAHTLRTDWRHLTAPPRRLNGTRCSVVPAAYTY